MGMFSEGLIVPLLTSPLGAPFTKTGYPCRGNERSLVVKPTSFRLMPSSFWRTRASRPTKSPFFRGGLELFVYKGIAAGGDGGTTVGDPDDRITIGSVGSSYHFLCCRYDRKVE